MKLLGFEITRQKAMASVGDGRGWWPLIRESFPGAWQRNVEVKFDSVLSNHADFACRTLIASDVGKLRIKLVRKADKIWEEITSPAFSPVLRKPNLFQTRQQFIESWVLSKLQRGNAYILKQRDERRVVYRLYVLDPMRVMPLVAEDGSVWYQLHSDNLAGIPSTLVVPASEIIHDRFNCFFHPLVGLSPIFASGLAAMQGLAIQGNSTTFFQNGCQPGGILTAPGAIADETALRLKEYWDQNFTGANRGKVAVLGDGLKYEALAVKAVDAQLIEQLKWTAEVICSTYHVPPYKVGMGAMPTYNNIQSLNVEYYSQCLQTLIEAIEACLDEGLALEGTGMGTEFDLDGLLRMDTTSLTTSIKEAVGGGVMTPNEGRRKLDLPPIAGGDSVYLQEQNYSLEALAKRDAREDPFNPPSPEPPSTSPPAEPDDDEEEARSINVAPVIKLFRKAS